MIQIHTPAWMEDAQCSLVDPELFFPGPGDHAADAKMVCASCPVQRACLDYGTENNLQGVWGGAALRHRKKLSAELAESA
jgi:hypothetical protein